MLERVKDWVRGLLDDGRQQASCEPERYARRYENSDTGSITAVVANKLAALVFADSGMEVLGENPRAELVRQVIGQLWEDGSAIVAQALGKGGKVLVPVARDGQISVHAVDQSRMAIRRMACGRLQSVTLLCGRRAVGDRWYYLLADYEMLPDGEQRIGYRACNADGRRVPLDAVPEWAGMTPEFTVAGTQGLLLGFLRCPRDDRTDHPGHGVPITFGAERELEELVEHMRVYRREYRLSRMMLGLDSALWRDPMGGAAASDIAELRRTVQDSEDPFIPWETSSLDGRAAWQVYAPQIRYEAMEARYHSLCRRIETACGLSQGILTERQRISYANKDEIRAALYDTFCVVRAVRNALERALQDVAKAVDALADVCGLPGGEWQLRLDWDYGLVESTEQTFAQNLELYERRLLSGAELRQWATNETLYRAERAIRSIAREAEAAEEATE